MEEVRFWMWVFFWALVPTLLAIDLLVLYRKWGHGMKLREAFWISVYWVGAGLAFGLLVFVTLGMTPGLEYITAFVVEKKLSMDNLFVFFLIFTAFAVPLEARHLCLFLGILGAIFFRGVFIFAGIEAAERWKWSFILLGAILLYTVVKLMMRKEEEIKPERIWLVRLARRFFRFSDHYEGNKFFIRKNGALYATPLFLVVAAIEGCDIIFAVDSVPAVLGITHDRLIAYSSNLFAILGLRALYFLLAALIAQFIYLRHGLVVVLGFIAVKLMLKPFHIEIPITISLAFVVGVLTLSFLVSILKMKARPAPTTSHHHDDKEGGHF